MLKASSLVEVVIGMIVCAILIGMVYAILTILSGQLLVLEKESRLTSDGNRLHWALQRAIYTNEKLYFTENHPVFVNNDNDTITFLTGKEWIIREAASFVDTFYVKGARFELDTLSSPNNTKTLQRLNLFVVVNDQEDTLGFYKEVYPDQLFKTEEWR